MRWHKLTPAPIEIQTCSLVDGLLENLLRWSSDRLMFWIESFISSRIVRRTCKSFSWILRRYLNDDGDWIYLKDRCNGGLCRAAYFTRKLYGFLDVRRLKIWLSFSDGNYIASCVIINWSKNYKFSLAGLEWIK